MRKCAHLIKGIVLSDILDDHVGQFLLGNVRVGLEDSSALFLRSDCCHDVEAATNHINELDADQLVNVESRSSYPCSNRMSRMCAAIKPLPKALSDSMSFLEEDLP